MRGLTLFITDVRKCKGKEEESKRIYKELANIRNKFKGDKLLNGYQKKKYICKLVFIFLLGYKFEIGLMEAINLLSSNAYSEKEAGYLFISLVKGEDYDLMPLVINALKTDLSSTKGFFQNLALQFIANNTSAKFADSLADPIINLLLCEYKMDSVKQSAILALLQFLRIKSDLVLTDVQLNYITNLISHHNLGVVTASASLVEFLAKKIPSRCETCVKHCINKVSRIVSCPCIDFRDYTYYSVTASWVIVKLLQILQNFPSPSDVSLKSRLGEALEMIIRTYDDAPKARKFEHNNTKYAMIFEAISLIIQMKLGGSVLSRAFSILGGTLQRKEVNLKCMALEMMARLTSNEMYLEHVKSQWSAVLNLLKLESDITIKKKAIDLLYIVCSEGNVKSIVNEMLYFLECKHSYSEDVILQTAALAEKFGNDPEWYFDTILNLQQICGGKMNDSVWYSLVKIVKDNKSIQEYAAKASYAVLCEKNCHDIVIKFAAYILGELGHLIARDPRSNYKLQFNALKQKYCNCSPSTKALLLTTFMKFHSTYPDLKDEVRLILKDKYNVQNENEEIQQRAVEYLKLSEIASTSLLATVLEEMPSDMRKISATVAAIENKKSQNPSLNGIENRPRRKNLTMYRSHCDLQSILKKPKDVTVRMTKSASHSYLQQESSSSNLNLLMDIFKDTPMSNAVTETFPGASELAPVPRNVPNNRSFLHSMLFNENAKLYENDVIAIEIESEFRKHFGRFHLKYINKMPNQFSEFSIQGNFANIENKCSIWFKPCNSILLAKGTIEQDIHLECLDEFSERPSLNLKFLSSKQCNKVKLILPLTLNKFVEPAQMTLETFSKRWKNFASVDQEVVKEFTAKYPMIYGVTRQKLQGFRLCVIENVDSESENFFCSGIFYTREKRVGFLIRLERYILNNKYSCRVRSSQFSLSRIISNLLLELL